tara:strand:- start:6 stop:632 length:627 start_codon:yes stop_codon:yes gene_type:complete
MSSSTTAVTLRFLGQGASATATSTDAIVLTVLAGQEEQVMEDIAGALANLRDGMTVVADDKNSKYLVPGVTAVSSISVDSGAGTFKNIIDASFSANNITVTNAQSGSVVLVPTTGDNSTITLPSSPIDGANYKFVAEASSGAHTITIAGAFYGVTLQAGDTVEHALGSSSAVIAASDFKIGDFFEIVYEGDAYHITGMFDTAASLAVS